MEEKINDYCNQLLRENAALLNTQNFLQNDHYKDETLLLILNEFIEYMQQSPSKTLNVLISKLFKIATSKNFSNPTNKNHFIFFSQILDKCFCILNIGEHSDEEVGIAEATQMIGIVFLPNIPYESIPFMQNIFSILAMRDSEMFQLFSTNIINDPKSDISHLILKAMVTNYSTVTSFLEVADNLFNAIPKKERLQFCQTLEEIISASVTNDSESFGPEIPGAEKLFEKIEKWGPPYWSAAVALLFLMPSKADTSIVSNLFSQIQNYSTSFSTSLQGMMMLLPAIICLSFVKEKLEYQPLSALCLPIIVKFVRLQIENLLQFPFASELVQSLPIIFLNDYPDLMTDVVLITVNANTTILNSKLPILFSKIAAGGRANELVHPLEIILNRSFKNRDNLAAEIFIKAEDIIPPFISDQDRSLLLSQYLEAMEDIKLLDVILTAISKCDKTILDGAVVILDYATMVVKSRLLDGNKLAEHMVWLACAVSKFAEQIKDLDPKTFAQYKTDLEIIGVLALPSTSAKQCHAALEILASIDIIISYKYETSFTELKNIAEAHNLFSVTNQTIRAALLSICYCSDSITEALTILLLHFKKIFSKPDQSIEEFANISTILLTFPTPIIDTIISTMVPMISERNLAAKRLSAVISSSLQITAAPFLIYSLYTQAQESISNAFVTNALFILSRAAEQQRWHQALSTIPDFPSLAELLLTYVDSSGDTELMFAACHLFLHIPSVMPANVRELFCGTAAKWANNFMLACASDHGSDAGACVTLSALIAVSEGLPMSSAEILARCANAAWRAVNMSTASSSVGARLLAALARSNGASAAPLLAARCAEDNKSATSAFCAALAEAVADVPLRPRPIAELVLESAFLECACECVGSSSAELYSNLIIESALALGRERELMMELARIELRGITKETLNTAFRQNGVASRAVANFPRLAAPRWATHFFAPAVFDLVDMADAGAVFEINPQRGETSPGNFLALLEGLTRAAIGALDCVPEPISNFLVRLYEVMAEKMGEYAETVISGLFYLRVALPMLTAPDNMNLGIPLSAAVRDALINASVVLMGAVNKGDLTEKRPHFHAFNEFAGRAQGELSGALLRVLQGKARTVPGESLPYSVALLERPVLSLLVSTSAEIMPALNRMDAAAELRERVNAVMEAPPGVMTRPLPSHSKNCSGAALAAIEAKISPRDMESAGRAVVRVGQNMIVVVPSRMPPKTPRMALTQQLILAMIDNKADFAIVVDGTDWDVADADMIVELFGGLPAHVQERVREVVFAGANPGSVRSIQRISELPLSKIIAFADKIPEFQMKYGNALPLFRRRLRMTFGHCVSTKASLDGATVVLRLFGYIIDVVSGLSHVQIDLSNSMHIVHAHKTLRIALPHKIHEFGHVDDLGFVQAVKRAAITSAPIKKLAPSDPIAELFALAALCTAQGGDGSALLRAVLLKYSENLDDDQNKQKISDAASFDNAAEEFAQMFGPRECAIAVDACISKVIAFNSTTGIRMIECIKPLIKRAGCDPVALKAILHYRSKGGEKVAPVIDETLSEMSSEEIPGLIELVVELNVRSFGLLESCAKRHSEATAMALIDLLPASAAIDGVGLLIDCGALETGLTVRLLARLLTVPAVEAERAPSLHALLGKLVGLLGGAAAGLEPLWEPGEAAEDARQRLGRGIGAVLARTRGSAPELLSELVGELETINSYRAQLALRAIDDLDSMLDK